MKEQGIISEQEFIAHCDESLRQLAHEVRSSGMSIYEIAKLARLQWRTVKKVVDCVPVRWDTAERIRYVLSDCRNRQINDTSMN